MVTNKKDLNSLILETSQLLSILKDLNMSIKNKGDKAIFQAKNSFDTVRIVKDIINQIRILSFDTKIEAAFNDVNKSSGSNRFSLISLEIQKLANKSIQSVNYIDETFKATNIYLEDFVYEISLISEALTKQYEMMQQMSVILNQISQIASTLLHQDIA